ncbi:MAG: LamG domain-containing protein, partial [Planctomycetes bacterium]|nr:LamG domain-containing protein [Planctomycetota bacterium]
MYKKLIYFVCFVLVLALAGNASADLLVHWKLDDGSGTIAKDSSGNGNHGTFNGAPKWVAGKIGGALEFDGVDDFVVYSFDQAQTFTAFSVAFWVKASSLGQPNYASPFTGHYPNTAGFQIDVNGGNPGEYRVNPGGLIFGTVTTDWIHLALTAEGTSAKLYYNGEWILDGTLNDSILNQFAIGVNRNRNWWLAGSIDELRVYDHALTQEEIEQAMIGIPPGSASNPSPANETTDVPRDVTLSWTPGEFAAPTNGHKVYLGQSFNDVNDATGGITQDANSYAPPQRLDFGKTYYWRIDEVNAPPTSQIEFKGEVWSFTTEPIAYAIENITATASSTHLADTGTENTINGLGLDVNDLHSIEPANMWLSGDEPNGAWIEYEFDKVYKLHQMWVWNHNGTMESILGFGLKDVTIEYS